MNITAGSRKADLRWSIKSLSEAIEFCKAEGEDYTRQAEMLAGAEAELRMLEANGFDTPGLALADTSGSGTARPLHARPEAGAPAANQYGVFTVAYATEKQTRFIGSLLERKDLSSLADSVTLDVARLREQVANNQVNKKAASAIIDRLLALPELTTARPAAPVNLATEKQQAFVSRLLSERGVTPAYNVAEMTKSQASAEIERLLAMPKVEAPKVEIEAGVYVLPSGQMVRVYFGQQSGQMLAKKVVDGELEYAGKAERVLVPGTRRATVEEVGSWGKTTGTCLVCGRSLDDPESVDRGIGPVCYSKF